MPLLLSGRAMWHSVFVVPLWINTVYNYACATWKSPGTTKDQNIHGKDTRHTDCLNTAECVTCKLPKATASHHCKECNSCILFMDHHCLALLIRSVFCFHSINNRSFHHELCWPKELLVFFPLSGVRFAWSSVLWYVIDVKYLQYIDYLRYTAWLTWPILSICWLDFTPRVEEELLCRQLGNTSLMFMASFGLVMCTGALVLIQIVLLWLDWSTLISLRFLQRDFSLSVLWSQLGKMAWRQPGSRFQTLMLNARPRIWQWLIPMTERLD